MSTELVTAPPEENVSSETTESEAKRVVEQEEIYSWFRSTNLKGKNLDWTVILWMIGIHAGALVAPFYFTWQAAAVGALFYWLTASIGICLGYHRFLSHRSMKLKWPAELFVLLCGAVSGEGSPLTWAANHRLHHQRSDLDGDPHSPREGRDWSHLLWLFVLRTPEQHDILFRRYVPDLVDRPLMRFFEKTYGLWLIGTAIAFYLLGGLPMLLWGVCVRMVVVYHGTWCVNSATHLWGYRNYETDDQSRNLWWVALLAWGEGWHNNHHAHPTLAPAGHKWWEVDMTWWSIKALRFFGLATDVKDALPKAEETHKESAESVAA